MRTIAALVLAATSSARAEPVVVHADPFPFATLGYGGQLGVRHPALGGVRVAVASFAVNVPDAIAELGGNAGFEDSVARSTLDADLVADLRGIHVAPLTAALERDYYIDREVADDAVRRRAMFNVIHLATMFKVDIYVLTERAFDRSSFARRAARSLDEPPSRTFLVDSPEDTVLHKLEWYRAGGEVSDRQWSDIIGVLDVQGDALDDRYLEEWASAIGVTDLLARARRAVGS